MMSESAYGVLSVALTVVATVPYCWGAWQGRIKPHAFSWFIWGVLGALGFSVQHASGAGPGAWANGAGAVSCLMIAGFAAVYGEKYITRGDVIALVSSLVAMPIWYITQDALYAAVWITLIDLIGYYPTFRKSWHKPQEELVFTHIMGTLKFAFSLAAMELFSLTNVLYPAAIVVANSVLIAMLLARRRALKVF